MANPINNGASEIDGDSINPLILIGLVEDIEDPVVMYRESEIDRLSSLQWTALCRAVTDLALEIAPFAIPDIIEDPEME